MSTARPRFSDSTPYFNPVADNLDELSRPVLEEIEDAIAEVTEYLAFEHNGFNGMRHATKDDIGEQRWYPTTDIECSQLEFDWLGFDNQTLDLRLPIPAQISAWLREQAEIMLEVADAVDAVPDLRNLNRICAIVGAVPIDEPDDEDEDEEDEDDDDDTEDDASDDDDDEYEGGAV